MLDRARPTRRLPASPERGIKYAWGASTGEGYAIRGFRLIDGQRCDDHEVRVYLPHLTAMRRVFDRLAVRARSGPP